MRSISILGSGWLGFPLARELKKSGWNVKGSSRNDDRLQELAMSGIEPFKIDIEILDKIVTPFFDSEILIINVPPRNGTMDHIKALKSLKKHIVRGEIKWVFYVGSTGIYPNLNKSVAESDASDAVTSRGGVNLLEAEELWRDEEAFSHTIIRFGGLYGPGREPARFLQGKKQIPGGLNPVNMIHLEDCIGSIKVLLVKALKNVTYNICSPHHPTRIAFYQEASQKAGVPAPDLIQNKTQWKIVDPGKFISQSGYSFKH